MSVAPRVPIEVIERIISHAGDDPGTLHGFSLTCRTLRPRSFCLMLAYGVKFNSRNHVFDFCDFLKDHPHLPPLVHSIAVHPEDLAPFPLLRILPNLSQINFEPIIRERPVIIPPSIQWSLQSHGTRIETLHFHGICFRTIGDFVRLLLAFTGLEDLSLDFIYLFGEVENISTPALLWRSEERLRKQLLGVKALTVCALAPFPTLG